MMLISFVAMILPTAVFLNANPLELETTTYLNRYGSIEDNSQADFQSALINLKEIYNLPVDGLLNADTLKLKNRNRCSVAENQYKIRSKWNKTHLFWYFSQAQELHIQVGENH